MSFRFLERQHTFNTISDDFSFRKRVQEKSSVLCLSLSSYFSLTFLSGTRLISSCVSLQRHCRLKHNGNIQVIENKGTEEDGPELSREGDSPQRNSSSKLNNSLLSSKRGSSKPSNQNPVSIDEDSMGRNLNSVRCCISSN